MISNSLFPTQFLIGRIGAKQIGLQSSEKLGIPLIAVSVDAMVTETHHTTATLTEYPIESGVSISDHVVVKPDEVTCECVVGPAPIYMGVLSAFSGSPVFSSYDTLWSMMTLGAPVSIVTGIRVYRNMIIEDLTVTRNAQNGQALEFTLKAKRAKIVMVTKVQSGILIAQEPVKTAGPSTAYKFAPKDVKL